MTKHNTQPSHANLANSNLSANFASHASFLTAAARPPHDPLQIPLDARIGWRICQALTTNIQTSALDGAITLSPDPASGRQLHETGGSFGGLTTPPNVAIGPDNSVFLMNWLTGQLHRFDACTCAFETLPCIGGFGTQPRQLGEFETIDSQTQELITTFPGIEVSNGNLYVADPGNHRLQVFSLHGFALRGFWYPPLEQQAQPWQPQAVCFDQCGNVLVADPANGCVHQFNSGGRWLQHIEGVGAVQAIAVNLANQLYVYRGSSNNILTYDLGLHHFVDNKSFNEVVMTFDKLPLFVTPAGCLNLSNLCLKEDTGVVLFDLQAKRINTPPANKGLPVTHQYAQQAQYVSTALDSNLYRCQWDRISLAGLVPEGTRVKLSTFTAETELSDLQILDLNNDAWSDIKTIFPGEMTQQLGSDLDWDCLIQSEPGRYLWLRIQMLSDGHCSPHIQRILIDFPRISLRRYLPSVLGEEPISADFTDRFLAIFDRGFRNIESRLDQLASYFDPLSAPTGLNHDSSESGQHNNFLAWLASWIGVTLDSQLPLEQQRRMLKQAGKLFPFRGTLCGLQKNLQLYLGLDQRQCQQTQSCAPCTTPKPPKWQIPQLILEHYQLRRWLFLGAGRLGDQSRLWGQSIVNRSQLSGVQVNGNAQLGVTQLKGTQDPFRDPMHVYAHKFSVFVPNCFKHSPQRRKRLERLIELEKPAHTAHQLIFVEPRFRIGVQSMIGFDTAIGCYPEGVMLNQSKLGKATVLGSTKNNGPDLSVGTNATIGMTTIN